MRWALSLAVCLAACTDPRWSDARTDLDRVPLSVWASGGPLFVVGGALGSGGQALFLRHDGAGWREIAVGSTSTLWWVHGLSASDVWAVGENGLVVHWDGSTLATETVPTTNTLFGVWGASDDDLWVVGGQPDIGGVILHRSNGAWTQVTGLPNTGTYFKVWGVSSNEVYICGQAGTILRWDGATWNMEASGLPQFISLFTVSGRSAPKGVPEVYAVGGLGNASALHRVPPPDKGIATWEPVVDKALSEAPALGGVAVASDGRVAMVGAGGTKLLGRPGAFSDGTEQATRADFHSVTFDGDQLWAVGGNWLAPPPSARHGVIVRYGD